MKSLVHVFIASLLIQPFNTLAAAVPLEAKGGGTPTVTISSGDSNASELGPDNASFTVTRTGGDIGSTLTVQMSLTGSAVRGTDYELTPGFITAVNISANQDSVIVTLTPLADNVLEGVEQATVTLTAGSGYQLGATTSVDVDIADDPVEVSLSSADTVASEAGPDTGTFTVARTGGDLDSTLTVQMSLTGTAILGTDYSLTPSFVTAVAVPGGQSSITVTLQPIPDNSLEGSENTIVTLTPDTNTYNLGSAITETIAIADDPVEVSISSTDMRASEVSLDPATFTVSRTGGNTSASLTAGISISGSATLGADYALTPAFVTAVTIVGGEPSVTVTLSPLVGGGDLPDDEGEETVIIDLTMGDYLIDPVSSTTTLIIDDQDALFSDGFETPAVFKSCIRELVKTTPKRFIDRGAEVYDRWLHLKWSSCGMRARFDPRSSLCQVIRESRHLAQADPGFGAPSEQWRLAAPPERQAVGGACEGSLVR